MEYIISRKEESFKVLFTLNPHPSWIVDTRTLRFLEVNQAATISYGYSKEEFLGMTLGNLCLNEDLPNLYRIQSTNFSDQNAVYKDVVHVLKDGSQAYREVISYKVNFEGKEARLALINDITERKFIENQLSNYITKLEKIAFYNSYNLRKPIAELLSLVQLLREPENCSVTKKLKESVIELDQLILTINQKLNDPEQFKV